jgi:NAD(P)-dependent dehydrogenase (short-subunit alcohol dehydrogenase family)
MAIRAIVVGGTNGIGYGMACRVAAEVKSSTVIISGRTKPQHIPHANMEFRPLDATSMRQIKHYTDTFKSAQEQKLDLLIMTQGIMTVAGRTETPEGIDRKMALHYYGKQLLIRELLPALKENAKVIIVFDGVYGNPTKLDWEDLDLKKHFSLGKSANHCMVMNDAMIQFHAAEQQRQGANNRHFVHAWPGAVNSNLFKELPWFLQPLLRVAGSLVGVSTDTCAERLLDGVSQCAAAGKEEGRFWSNIDNKGRLVAKKTIWTEAQMKTVADHTWELVDRAIESSPE